MIKTEDGIQDQSVEFLLVEFQEIAQETRRIRVEGLSRMNLYITLTSSILAGLILISQIDATSILSFQAISIGAMLFLALIGWNTFQFSISRDINTERNIRATNRIRRFFVDNDPELGLYLTWNTHDEPMSWITHNRSNVRGMAQSILSFVIATMTGLITYLVTATVSWSVIVGVPCFAVAMVSLNAYANRRYGEAEDTAQRDIRFPKSGRE